MIETKTYSAMLYSMADELRKASPAHPVLASPKPLEEAAERLDTLTVTIRGLEIQRDELAESMRNIFPAAHRLALELEALLLSCNDNAAVSKWWDSAHEALEQWRQYCQDGERP